MSCGLNPGYLAHTSELNRYAVLCYICHQKKKKDKKLAVEKRGSNSMALAPTWIRIIEAESTTLSKAWGTIQLEN